MGKVTTLSRKTVTGEEIFLEKVKTPLTERELLAYSDELARLNSTIEDTEQSFKTQKDNHKALMTALKRKETSLFNLLKTKEEMKDTDCYEEFNFFEGIVTIRQVDGDKEVRTRKITADEYQQNLPLSDQEN
jgi:hypothetical protein